MKPAKGKTIEFFREKGGLVRTTEALAYGIHRKTLYGLRDEGVLRHVDGKGRAKQVR